MNAVYLAVGILAVVAQVHSQCIPSCAAGIAPNCGCPAQTLIAAPPAVVAAPAPVLAAPAPIVSPTIIAPNSVAATLADTLSLLTVSSLLAETLPYSYPCAPPPVYAGCGCGYPQPYSYVL